jgi:hypothetical protein
VKFAVVERVSAPGRPAASKVLSSLPVTHSPHPMKRLSLMRTTVAHAHAHAHAHAQRSIAGLGRKLL